MTKRKLRFSKFAESLKQSLQESGSLAWIEEYSGARTEEEILGQINKYKSTGEFDSYHMHMIIDGIKQELPVDIYANPVLEIDQVTQLKLALEDGVRQDEIEKYDANNPKYDSGKMSVILSVIAAEKDPTILLDENWTFEQLLELETLITYMDNPVQSMNDLGITYFMPEGEMHEVINNAIFN